MSDQKKVTKCEGCGTSLREFVRLYHEGSTWISECPSCGQRYSLYFLPGSKSNAFIMENHGVVNAPKGDVRGAPVISEEGRPSSKLDEARVSESGGYQVDDRQARSNHIEEIRRQMVTEAEEGARRGAPRRARKSDDINSAIAKKLKEFRILRGLSQQKLGKAIGLTFQQIQKYENRTNRIPSDRIVLIAHVLQVPVARFYEDVDAPQDVAGPELTPKELRMLRYFATLSQSEQDHIYDLVSSIANTRTGHSGGEEANREAAE